MSIKNRIRDLDEAILRKCVEKKALLDEAHLLHKEITELQRQADNLETRLAVNEGVA